MSVIVAPQCCLLANLLYCKLRYTFQHYSEGGDASPYMLLSGYPPRPLTNHDQTLAEAKLAGEMVTQKLTS
jgi:hypothetical protein